MNILIAYILLPDKKQSTYETALFLFNKHSGKCFPLEVTFSIDFGIGEIYLSLLSLLAINISLLSET